MDEQRSTRLAGYLLDLVVRPIERTDIEECRDIKFVSRIEGTHWEKYMYSSELPLRKEENEPKGGPYQYELICRRSGSRIVMLSLSRDIIDHLLLHEFIDCSISRIRHKPIAVDNLVKNLAKAPAEYAINFVYARTPAFGASLRTISCYGDDLADASFFLDNMYLMNFYTCGLRRITEKTEVVRLGSDGMISFRMTDKESVLKVEAVLSYLKTHDYLDDNVLE